MKVLYGILAGISFIVLMGTAGASDTGSISFTQTILQCVLSFGAFLVFLKLAINEERFNDAL